MRCVVALLAAAAPLCSAARADTKLKIGYGPARMPDIDGTLKEIAYGLDELKADGVAMSPSYGGTWLGDPAFAPVFEELNRRKAVVYTHPTTANCCRNLVPDLNDSAIEYGTDTTRAIARMIFSGSSARYPVSR